jgi:hypothetical protein
MRDSKKYGGSQGYPRKPKPTSVVVVVSSCCGVVISHARMMAGVTTKDSFVESRRSWGSRCTFCWIFPRTSEIPQTFPNRLSSSRVSYVAVGPLARLAGTRAQGITLPPTTEDLSE